MPRAEGYTLTPVACNPEQIVRHRVESGVNNLVVHGENEHGMKVTLERALEGIARLAIHVTCLALRGRMALRFQRWHTEDGNACRCQ